MGGKKNREKGSGKPRSSSTPSSPSSQVYPLSTTTSTSSARHLARELMEFVGDTWAMKVLIMCRQEPAALNKLSELLHIMTFIASEYAIHRCTVIHEKESLYCADPIFISFPAFRSDYEFGPTQELEDLLGDTVSVLSGIWMKASQFHTESENDLVKHVLEKTISDVAALTNSFLMRIEGLRQQRQANNAANVVTARSVDVELLISVAVDKLSYLVLMLGAFRTGDKEMMDAVTSEARALEKTLFFFLRPKEGSQELSSLSVDTVRYHRKVERRLDFIFHQIVLSVGTLTPLMARKNSGNAIEILEHFYNVAEMLWAVREIVRRRESSVDEYCLLMVERSGLGAVKPTQETGDNKESSLGVANLSEVGD